MKNVYGMCLYEDCSGVNDRHMETLKVVEN